MEMQAARPQDLGLVSGMSTAKERLGRSADGDTGCDQQRAENIRVHTSKF